MSKISQDLAYKYSYSHKEEKFEKLKVQTSEYQAKTNTLDKTFEKHEGSEETERLQNTLEELKSKLEELEVNSYSKSLDDSY